MREVKHCAWPTPAPDVCTANWDQAAWDNWGERYRPEGYTNAIHDSEAFVIWSAWKIIENGLAAQERLARRTSESTLTDRVTAALLTDALRVADTCRASRRGAFCELGTCLVCTVARLSRGETV